MNHLKAISIKFIYIALIILSLFGIFLEATLTNLFLMSVFTTLFAYLIGDLLIYTRLGNVLATILDFPLSFLVIISLGGIFLEVSTAITITSLASAFFIMCIEPLFHAYLTERIFMTAEEDFIPSESKRKITRLQPKYMTELAEEESLMTEMKKEDEEDL